MNNIIPHLNASLQTVVSCFHNVVESVLEYYYYARGTAPEGFEPEDVREYLALTHLSKRQIFKAFRMFVKATPVYIESRINPYVHKEKAATLPLLRHNPFADRLIEIFSSEEYFLTFEDFLSMITIFSPETSFDVKTQYAFWIYDMDCDDQIGLADMLEIMRRLDHTNELNEDELEDIINLAMCEGDIDGDKYMTYTEFVHSMWRMPDFMKRFAFDI